MFAIRGLNAYYGRAHILFDVTLQAARGEAVALLGRNGAGKSTTLRSIMGLGPTVRGEVEFEGAPLHGLPTHAIARRGLAYVPEERRVFSDLTVLENLKAGARPARPGVPRWPVPRVLELFPKLGALQQRRAGQLSGGEQQMLAVARGLMGNPALLLLDEVSEGLAPAVVEQLAGTLRELRREGLTVLLCEQNLRFAMAVCDRAYVLAQGRVAFEGSIAELGQNAAALEGLLAVAAPTEDQAGEARPPSVIP